jgi:beta-lactamase regulating signal transducer with metallopeptidase domain
MMTTSNWLSPEVMRPAGWALLHFLWQGTALAALATVAMAPFRKASARYVVAVGVLLIMLAAPVATFFYYRNADAVRTWTASAPTAVLPNVAQWRPSAPAAPVMSRSVAPDLFPWMVEAWLLGVALFSLRSAGGFLLLERMRRRQSVPVDSKLGEICVELQRRLGLTRAIRYAQCQWLEAPAVIGWFRPVVFLPLTALTGLSEAQLQVVIAHELAHIRRLDSFVNAFQVFVETLLFYHPAVWWLNKRIRLERENCCDDIAIALCGNAVEYARALTLMEEWRVAPALAMAANRGPLSARITRLLGIGNLRSGIRGIGLTSSALCLTVALIAGNAIFGIAHKASAQSTTPTPPSGALPATPSTPSRPAVKTVPAAKPSPAPAPEPPVEPVLAGSYIDGLKAAGLSPITVDELIALKVQGVTPEYVRAIREYGVHMGVDEIVGMKVQGVTPEYIRDLRAAGVTLSSDEIIAMKVQGVDANYVRGIQEAGLRVNADDVIGMKVQGVTPEYVRALKEQGVETSADDVIGMRVQGVTPEYVREIRALGLKPTSDELIGMRVQGVTPQYIKALQAAGLKFDIDELIGAKVQGITPEFVEKARAHGFQNLDLEKLIQLKHMGVLDKEGEI